MKKCIYVVDDQAAVLEMAVLIIRTVDPEWEVTGFKNPSDALSAVRTRAPDLVLSDQVMPEMDGSELLEQIRAISPTTIRIIVSGCVPLNKLAFITSAHHYIAKPFDTMKLRETIRRGFAAQERMADKDMQAVATSLRSIPSLPQVYHALTQALQSDRNASSTIAGLLAEDPGMTAKVLHLANSPLFGQNSIITTPFDAVMCLGTEMIMAVVLSQSLFSHYESLVSEKIDMGKVWNHCWQTASLAQQICREMKLSRARGEEAFLSGLLHETGRFILVDNFPDRFQAACQRASRTKSPLAPRLKEEFRTAPAHLTAYVLELWGMPANVIGAIASLDAPADGQAGEFTIASALYVADGVSSRQSPPDTFPPEEWDREYLKAIGCLENIPAWEKLSTGPQANSAL
jgi:HD-like signal output (HDOD) protein